MKGGNIHVLPREIKPRVRDSVGLSAVTLSLHSNEIACYGRAQFFEPQRGVLCADGLSVVTLALSLYSNEVAYYGTFQFFEPQRGAFVLFLRFGEVTCG